MKRTALARGKPLRTTKPLARTSSLNRSPMRGPIKAGADPRRKYSESMMRVRKRRQRSGADDPKYLAWIRRKPCRAPGCGKPAPSRAHHHNLTQLRGTSQKAPDRFAIPLCDDHHVPGIHALRGPFAGWTKAESKAWQDEQCRELRAEYEREMGRAA